MPRPRPKTPRVHPVPKEEHWSPEDGYALNLNDPDARFALRWYCNRIAISDPERAEQIARRINEYENEGEGYIVLNVGSVFYHVTRHERFEYDGDVHLDCLVATCEIGNIHIVIVSGEPEEIAEQIIEATDDLTQMVLLGKDKFIRQQDSDRNIGAVLH